MSIMYVKNVTFSKVNKTDGRVKSGEKEYHGKCIYDTDENSRLHTLPTKHPCRVRGT